MLLEVFKKSFKWFVFGLVILLLVFSFLKRKPTFLPQPEADSLALARQRMVEHDLAGRDITDSRVLKVMGEIERRKFVDKSLWSKAYADHPLPIGFGQTISQPYVVALMTQSLNLKGGEEVLEIGTGSGYQTAVLSRLIDQVYTIEIIKDLAEQAKETLREQGFANVWARNADGYFGWEEHAPFDAIMITAALDHVPSPLFNQLKDGGRLIIPLGSTKYFQTLTLITKKGENYESSYITTVSFVPMTGEVQRRD